MSDSSLSNVQRSNRDWARAALARCAGRYDLLDGSAKSCDRYIASQDGAQDAFVARELKAFQGGGQS